MKISFDIIGEVAIFDLPPERKEKPLDIAREILKNHKSVKTVLQKMGEREGKYRLRKMKKIVGKETETIHKEHGFRFLLDPTKVFFSPRDATERERIASQVKPGETVMVMFAGAGPYGIVIAGKNPQVSKVYQVEHNPAGFEYMKRNISMNKLSHLVVPIHGNVREACKPYFGKCDRVLTPLAKHAHEYLDTALSCLLVRKGIIHFYDIGKHGTCLGDKEAQKELFSVPVERLEKAARKAGRKLRILDKRKVLPFSPGSWKVCIEAEVSK